MPRDLALRVLNTLDLSPDFSDRCLERAFERAAHLDERDRAFVVHLVQGVLRWRLRLDWIIEEGLRFPFNRIAPPVLNILRMGVYQIFFMDRVPDSAAVDEAVKQAKAIGKRHVAGSVNAILRNVCRHKEHITFPPHEPDPARHLSVYYSYPVWLVKKWVRELGISSTERLLEAENEIPPLVIRTNTRRVDRAGLIRLLEEEGVRGRPTPYAPEGIKIDGVRGPVNLLKGFKGGLFQVQGEAAQISSHLLFPEPGELILDLCSGLGGKATHLAQLAGPDGRIVALDTSHSRLVRLLENSRRLGVGPIESIVSDAGSYPSLLFRRDFHKILIDGPCSGLGIISRHPDIKWARNEGDIKRLARLQKSMLNQAASVLKKGGRMLYVTCTVSREENEGVVNDLLRQNSGMVLEDLGGLVPEWCIDLIDEDGFFRPLPHIQGMEGFFGALFSKIG